MTPRPGASQRRVPGGVTTGVVVMRALLIVEALGYFVESELHVAVTLVNQSDGAIGPGGLRLAARRSGPPTLLLSLPNLWQIEPGAHVLLSTFLPRNGLKSVDFVDYVGYDGTTHAIGDHLSIGWLFTELKRGTTGADVQA